MTKNFTALKVLFGGMSVGMIILVIFTSLKSNMFQLPECVLKEPWFWTTLVDFYFNITIISAWTVYKENNAMKSSLWIIAFVLLGSIATSFYVLLQFLRLKEGEGLEAVFLRRN